MGNLHSELPPYLNIEDMDALIKRALSEDIGSGDVTTLATIPAETHASAYFLAKEDGILAGLVAAERIFLLVNPELQVKWQTKEGKAITHGQRFGTISGPARSLLTAERLVLNLMQRMSGIATLTHKMVQATHPYPAKILDTRKTVPGLRQFDKWAVRTGGGTNHRIGLYDRVLIKDNHIAACGGITEAIHAAYLYVKKAPHPLKIEVEARTLQEVQEVLSAGKTDYILLDNMVSIDAVGTIDTSRLKEAVELVNGTILTEASGNVTLDTVPAIAATGVDYISSGALTHSVRALDISLKIALE